MKDSEEWSSIFDTTHKKNNPTELMQDIDLIYICCGMYIESVILNM